MANGSNVAADTVRIEILDGAEWIEVKSELSYGEQQRLAGWGAQIAARARDEANDDPDDMGISLDWAKLNVHNLLMWLVDWSLKDAEGKPLPLTYSSVYNLRRKVGEAIDDAITQHKAELEKNE